MQDVKRAVGHKAKLDDPQGASLGGRGVAEHRVVRLLRLGRRRLGTAGVAEHGVVHLP